LFHYIKKKRKSPVRRKYNQVYIAYVIIQAQKDDCSSSNGNGFDSFFRRKTHENIKNIITAKIIIMVTRIAIILVGSLSK
jgi:preprotein translocase subunit SecG